MKILIEDVIPIKAVIPGFNVKEYIPLSDLLAFLPECWSLSCQCIFRQLQNINIFKKTLPLQKFHSDESLYLSRSM